VAAVTSRGRFLVCLILSPLLVSLGQGLLPPAGREMRRTGFVVALTWWLGYQWVTCRLWLTAREPPHFDWAR
jgi:hypothetical protein